MTTRLSKPARPPARDARSARRAGGRAAATPDVRPPAPPAPAPRSKRAAGKASDGPGLPLRFGFLLHDVSRLRRTLFDQRMKPLGITRSQWWVLGQLSRAKGAPMSQVELARLLDVGKAALGGLVDRLERTGYVTRIASADDRRVKQVALTPKGAEFLGVMEAVGLQLNAETTRGIDPDELARFEATLERMKRNLVDIIRAKA